MQSKATTVADYLKSLPEDRREALETLRTVFRKNMDPLFEEGMQYGMIGYYLPHSIYPAGYHCDPRQPLPFAGLASQKNHLSLYLMCLYAESELLESFADAWRSKGFKLDMGKCCVRFRSISDVPLDVVASLLKRVSARDYVAHYEANLGPARTAKAKAGSGNSAVPAAGKGVRKAKATAKASTTVATKTTRTRTGKAGSR